MLDKGTIVTIRKDLSNSRRYNGIGVATAMLDYRGKVATIVDVEKDSDCDTGGYYRLNIDGQRWCWTDDMFNLTLSWCQKGD